MFMDLNCLLTGRTWRWVAAICFFGLAAFPEYRASAQEEPERAFQPQGREQILVYPIRDFTASSLDALKTRISEYLDQQGRYAVFQIDCSRGDLRAAIEAARFIQSQPRLEAYAFIEKGGVALGPGAIFALACGDIAMGDDSAIGNIETPPSLTEEVGQSLREIARTQRFPQVVLEAMLDPSLKVLELQRKSIDDKYFVTQAEFDNYLDRVPEARSTDYAPLVVTSPGERLALTHKRAFDIKISQVTVDNLIAFKEEFQLQGELIYEDESEDPRAALPNLKRDSKRLISSGLARFFFVTLGVVFLTLEFQFAGTLVWAILGLLSFALYFLGGYFEGMVGWLEVTLFLMSGVLIAFEIFVIPGFGIAGFLGLSSLFASLVLALQVNSEGYTPGQIVSDSAYVVGAMAIAGVALLVVLQFLPRASVGGVVQKEQLSSPSALPGIGAGQSDYNYLMSKRGQVTASLRPAGKAEFDGTEYDVVGEGAFVDRGEEVEVIEVKGNRIVVRKVEDIA